MTIFNYEKKMWGTSGVGLLPIYLGSLKLKRILADFNHVHGKVLDVGCGGGGFVAAIKYYRHDLTVYGVDVSKKAIKLAKKNVKDVNLKVGSAYKIPFPDKYFDGVITTDVLEHLDNPEIALKEINRVLKKGGVFSSSTPLEGNLFSFSGLLIWATGFHPLNKLGGHIQKFSNKSLVSLIQKSGFKIDNYHYYGHLFYQLVDYSFFAMLYLFRSNLNLSVEGFVSEKKSVFRNVIGIFKSILSILFYIESYLLYFFPFANGVHLKGIKG